MAKIAKEMAGVFYEEQAHDDDFFKLFPNQEAFIERQWWRFLESARQSLWALLHGAADEKMMKDGMSFDAIAHLKEETLEILMLDKSLPTDGTPIEPKDWRQ